MVSHLSKIVFIILFICSPASAFMQMVGNHVVEAGGLCSGLDANAVYYWGCDYDTGDTDTKRRTACTVASTLVGTLTTATITSGQNHTPGGTYALYGDGTDNQNAYIEFSNSGGELTSAEGFIELWVYPTDITDDIRLFSASVTGYYINVFIESDDSKVKFYFDGGANVSALISDDTITLNQWNQIEVRWNTTSDQISVNIDSGTWKNKSDVSIDTWSSEPTEFYIGATGSVYQLAGYIDDVQIWQQDDKTAP